MPLIGNGLRPGEEIAAIKHEPVCPTLLRDTRFEEDCMTLKKVCLGVLALSLLAIPAAAQKGRSNKGGAQRGDNRADVVQAATKKDKDRDPLPDNDKNKGKHKGETKGKHKDKGHSH